MRGSPLLQTIFIVLAFVLAGLPVWRLTRTTVHSGVEAEVAVANGATAEPSADRATPLDVDAVFAPAPTDFEVKNLDHTILAGRGPQARYTARWTTFVPPEGVDLVVRAHWDASAGDASGATGGPAAARITVRFVDGHQVEKSFWAAANGTIAEVFTVPGGPAAGEP